MTEKPLKHIYWHGDSLDVVRTFSRSVRVDIEIGRSRYRDLLRKK